jgi:hypothetical protein
MILHIPLFNKQTTPIDGITLFIFIFIWVKEPSKQLIIHEQQHAKQWLRQPFTFHFRYFYQLFRNRLKGMAWKDAYRHISYEVDARKVAEFYSIESLTTHGVNPQGEQL